MFSKIKSGMTVEQVAILCYEVDKAFLVAAGYTYASPAWQDLEKAYKENLIFEVVQLTGLTGPIKEAPLKLFTNFEEYQRASLQRAIINTCINL